MNEENCLVLKELQSANTQNIVDICDCMTLCALLHKETIQTSIQNRCEHLQIPNASSNIDKSIEHYKPGTTQFKRCRMYHRTRMVKCNYFIMITVSGGQLNYNSYFSFLFLFFVHYL